GSVGCLAELNYGPGERRPGGAVKLDCRLLPNRKPGRILVGQRHAYHGLTRRGQRDGDSSRIERVASFHVHAGDRSGTRCAELRCLEVLVEPVKSNAVLVDALLNGVLI